MCRGSVSRLFFLFLPSAAIVDHALLFLNTVVLLASKSSGLGCFLEKSWGSFVPIFVRFDFSGFEGFQFGLGSTNYILDWYLIGGFRSDKSTNRVCAFRCKTSNVSNRRR